MDSSPILWNCLPVIRSFDFRKQLPLELWPLDLHLLVCPFHSPDANTIRDAWISWTLDGRLFEVFWFHETWVLTTWISTCLGLGIHIDLH